MSKPEGFSFELEGGKVAWATISGVLVGMFGTAFWESSSLDAQRNADSLINDAKQRQSAIQSVEHDIQIAGQDESAAGKIVSQSLQEQNQKVDALVAERPVVHTARDGWVGVGGTALLFAGATVAWQYRKQRREARSHQARVHRNARLRGLACFTFEDGEV